MLAQCLEPKLPLYSLVHRPFSVADPALDQDSDHGVILCELQGATIVPDGDV